MERTAYRAMAEMAIEKFQHLTAFLPNDVEVVYVVSSDVYGAMIEYEEYNPAARITPYTTAGIYYGARVARINEVVAEPVFTPVVYSRGFQHYDAVQVNDYVIFNDEDNDLFFRLVRRTPDAMYTNTGLTVSFGENNAAAIQLADGTITLNLDGAQINVDLLQELAGEVSTPRRAKKRASKEKELNPGDTKLLDEYLHSFTKGGC